MEGEDSERWTGQGKITRSSELSEIGDEVIPRSGKQRISRSLQTMGEIWRHLRAENELKNYQVSVGTHADNGLVAFLH